MKMLGLCCFCLDVFWIWLCYRSFLCSELFQCFFEKSKLKWQSPYIFLCFSKEFQHFYYVKAFRWTQLLLLAFTQDLFMHGLTVLKRYSVKCTLLYALESAWWCLIISSNPKDQINCWDVSRIYHILNYKSES